MLLDELTALGVGFVSLGEGIDTSTPAGRLQLHILGAIAEFERARIAERVRLGVARAKAQGKRLGRPRRNVSDEEIAALAHLGETQIEELNRACDAIKLQVSGNRRGGDPDLFVFSESGDCFFVEVKDQDELKKKQRATFSTMHGSSIAMYFLARVKAEPGAKPGDGLHVVSRPANNALQPTSRAKQVGRSTGRSRAARS